jgi:hypothetical protein
VLPPKTKGFQGQLGIPGENGDLEHSCNVHTMTARPVFKKKNPRHFFGSFYFLLFCSFLVLFVPLFPFFLVKSERKNIYALGHIKTNIPKKGHEWVFSSPSPPPNRFPRRQERLLKCGALRTETRALPLSGRRSQLSTGRRPPS